MSKQTLTFHLSPLGVWMAQQNQVEYLPEAFATEGFIHCTDGEAEVLAAGNRYYTADTRDYCLLSIDVARLSAPVKYEDPGRMFPHIYGALNTDAVVAVRRIVRDKEGRFTGIGPELS